MKVLVTGAAGFIGFHLTKRLLSLNYKIFGIDNINDYYDVSLKYARLTELGVDAKNAKNWNSRITSVSGNFTFIRMNLEDKNLILELFESEKFDVVFNLGAQAGVRYSVENPSAYIDSNVVGFINILEGCRYTNVKHLLYASSSSVYGDSDNEILSVKDRVDNPISVYAATKKSNELLAHTYSHLYGLKTTGLRFFTVYGPWGRPDMAIFLFTKAITENRSIDVYNNGNMNRDFTYIDDVINGVLTLMENSSEEKVPYRIVNIGKGSPHSLMEFISVIEKCLGKKAKMNFLPMQQGDVVKTYADITELEKLGYRSVIDIQKGVKEFIDWYSSFYNI